MRKPIAIALTLFSVAACGGKPAATTAAAAPAPAPAQPQRGSSRDVITRAEIDQAGAANVYDLVNRLRPHFLRVEGRSSMGAVPQSPLVRLNASILGEIDAMRSIDITTVEDIRYYTIVEAESRFSGARGRPVIAITTKKLTGQ